jgi:hypothetical protein
MRIFLCIPLFGFLAVPSLAAAKNDADYLAYVRYARWVLDWQADDGTVFTPPLDGFDLKLSETEHLYVSYLTSSSDRLENPTPPYLAIFNTAAAKPIASQSAAASQPLVRVRVGVHPGYNRLVFDWTVGVPYHVVEKPSRATIYFERPATLDLSRYWDDPPPMIKRVTSQRENSGLVVHIEISEGARVRHFRHGTKVVIDVLATASAGAAFLPRQHLATDPKAKPPAVPARKSPPPSANMGRSVPSVPAQSTQERSRRQSAPHSFKAKTEKSQKPKLERSPTKTANANSVRRNTQSWGLTLGPNASTLGFGVEIGYRFNDYFGLRIGGNYYTHDGIEVDVTDIDYDADLSLGSAGAVVDIYPFRRTFRVTGGLRYNGNTVDLTSTPTSNVTIGGTPFTPSQVGTLDGDISFSDYAPYVGIGVEETFLQGRLIVGADLGVFFQGEPRVDLKSNGTLANDPFFRTALDLEEEDIEENLKFLNIFDPAFYPVIGVSILYRF